MICKLQFRASLVQNVKICEKSNFGCNYYFVKSVICIKFIYEENSTIDAVTFISYMYSKL